MLYANYVHNYDMIWVQIEHRVYMEKTYVDPNWLLLFQIHDSQWDTKFQIKNAQKG